MSNKTRPWMNEELDMLRETARRFFLRECVPNEMRWREQHHAERELWNKAGARACCAPPCPRNTAAVAATSCMKR